MKKRSTKRRSKRLRKAGKDVRRQQRSTAAIEQTLEQVMSSPQESLELAEPGLGLMLEGDKESSLARAKTHWFFGEWKALASLDLERLRGHPDRNQFALLAASAHQQLGNHEGAREFIRMALEWGCPPRMVAQILVAGVHNTLGRAAALKKDEGRVERHFSSAVAATSNKETALVSHARAVREMAGLGLLPQAATLVEKELSTTQVQRPHEQQARIKVLETEMELLRHELSLAEQRQQLFGGQRSEVSESDETAWLDELKKRSVSQLGQDLWVLERTDYKRGGFFVEFGATDGVLLSNTWLLEKEFGWGGLCAEPNPKFFKQLKQNRSCGVSDACIGATTGEQVEFIFADVYGGAKKHATSDGHADRRMGYLADSANSASLRTVSLNDFLLQMNAPRHIDYLSIDTEGSEFEILSAFPFDEWRIDYITVEHNYTEQRELLNSLLESRGYSRIEADFDDWYFRKNLRDLD